MNGNGDFLEEKKDKKHNCFFQIKKTDDPNGCTIILVLNPEILHLDLNRLFSG